MKRIIAVLLICALCVGLLLYNLFGVEQPAEQACAGEKQTASAEKTEEKQDPEPGTPPVSGVQVSVLNGDPDRQAAWEQIGSDYKKATGVEVVILDGTEQCQPTIFTVTDGTELNPAVCQDLSGTAACAQLADIGLTLTVDGKVCGIATEVACFGLLYNENLLAEVATPEEIYDIDSFSKVVQNLIQKGYTAFAGRGLNDGVALRLASIPGNIRTFADVWAQSSAKEGEGTALERFIAGESVFYLGGTDEYETITAAGIDRLGILPIYQDAEVASNSQQSLCVTAKGYWCVRSDVSQEQAAAAIAFLDYLLTSSEEGHVPVDTLELLAPYRQAAYCANPLENVLRRDVAAGKGLLVCQAVSQVPEGFADALTAYAQNPADENWSKVLEALGR